MSTFKSREEIGSAIMSHMMYVRSQGKRPCRFSTYDGEGLSTGSWGHYGVVCTVCKENFLLFCGEYSSQERQAIIEVLLNIPNTMIVYPLNAWERLLDDDLV